MLVDEGSGFVRVAFEADGVLRRGGAYRTAEESSMRVVAVVALHQPFVDAVVEGAVELLLHFLVAAVAKQRRLFLHQELAFLRMVGRVAVYAAHVVLQVRGTSVVAVLLSVCVASKAACADLRCRGVLEGKDPGLVTTTFDVRFPRTVACFTTVPLRALFGVKCRDKVRRVFVRLIKALRGHVFMAGLASFRADVERRIRGPFVDFRSACGLRLASTLLRSSGDDHNRNQRQYGKDGNGGRKVATNRLRHPHPPLLQKFRPNHPAGPSIHSKPSGAM